MMDKIPETLRAVPSPRKWLGIYGDFITKNAGAVSQIETSLRSFAYIIPARFKDVELASESIYSGVQLLSLYHDKLLQRAADKLPPSVTKPPPTQHNRYTRFWMDKSPTYRKVAMFLTMIRYTELWWEMAARRRGEKLRWRVVILIEAIKAMLRLILLRVTRSRMTLSPPIPEREIDPALLQAEAENISFAAENAETINMQASVSSAGSSEAHDSDASTTAGPASSTTSVNSSPSVKAQYILPRTGIPIPDLPDTPAGISKFLLSKVLHPEDVKAPFQLLHKIHSNSGMAAEVIYTLRPLVYAIAMRAWQKDKKSWHPWLLGFGLEYAARELKKKDLRDHTPGGLKGLTTLEKEELNKRGNAMWWWGLRGAFYENVSKGFINGVASKLEKVPVLGLAGGVIKDYQYLWDTYHFSTSTM